MYRVIKASTQTWNLPDSVDGWRKKHRLYDDCDSYEYEGIPGRVIELRQLIGEDKFRFTLYTAPYTNPETGWSDDGGLLFGSREWLPYDEMISLLEETLDKYRNW